MLLLVTMLLTLLNGQMLCPPLSDAIRDATTGRGNLVVRLNNLFPAIVAVFLGLAGGGCYC